MMGDQHTKHCHQKWDILKNYVAFEMLNDIGIEPYFVTSGIQFSHLSGINQHIAQILSMGDRFANFIHQEMPEVVKTQIDEFARTHSSVDGVFISTE